MIRLCLLLMALLGLCVAAQPKPPRKVVLVMLRGAAEAQVKAYLARGVLPPQGGLARLFRRGLHAKYLRGVDGTFTATSPASLLTGAYPDTHGVVGNVYHVYGEPITRETAGFAARFEAETLTEAAARQGKCVISLFPIHADATPNVRVYSGSESHSSEFARQIEQQLGRFPGGPDNEALAQGRIDEQTWLNQAERLARFKRDVALWCLREQEFDLLLFDENVVDNVSHQFFLRAARQAGYHDEQGAKRARFARHVEWSWQLADRHLSQLIEAAPPQTIFAVASLYGMTPVHTAVSVQALLVKAGLHVAADEQTEARAFAYGPLAHIRFNVAGREPMGVVSPEKLASYVERFVTVCRAARDVRTGERIFERVLKRGELRAVRLGHARNAGDVVLFARPGFVLSDQPPAPNLRPRFLGDHGYLSHHRAMRGVFVATGPGLRRGVRPVIRVVDVAPTVSAWLGIAPPRRSQGRGWDDALAHTRNKQKE